MNWLLPQPPRVNGAVRDVLLMNAAEMIDELTYLNYAFNRDRSPHITPERWKRIYGPGAERMEANYQTAKVLEALKVAA